MKGDKPTFAEPIATAIAMVGKARFNLTEEEAGGFREVDFGLKNFAEEGVVLLDLLRTDRVRVTLLVLLPDQTLPEHLHPSYDAEPGKEESVRLLFGRVRIGMPGEPNYPGIRFPGGKEAYYTARHVVELNPVEQFTVPANTRHWFQAGSEGAVMLAVQNRVNEDFNQFSDPASDGCPIPNSNTIAS